MSHMNDVVRKLGADGWAGLQPPSDDDVARRAAERAVRTRDQALAIDAYFKSDAGQAVLAWLVELVFLRPLAADQTTATTCEAKALAAARREGEQNLVRTLFAAIDVAHHATAPRSKE